MPAIPITGVGADYLTPGGFVEINFNQGPATSAAGAREIVLVGVKLSGGSWTAATLNQITSEQDVINGAGAGSQLHRVARALLAVTRSPKIWCLPVAETVTG